MVLVLILGVLGAIFFVFESYFYDEKDFYKWIKIGLIAFITGLFLIALIPSSKTLAAMYIIPPIANNQAVQELPKEVLNFVKEYLKDQRNDSDI